MKRKSRHADSREDPIRVLMIEDNPVDLAFMKKMLTTSPQGSFLVHDAGRLKDGFKHLAGSKTDIILLDLGLPDSQGLKTLSRLRQKESAVPVVVLTALDDEKAALDAVREGAEDYLVKGEFNRTLLMRVIRYAVERHRLQGQLLQAQKMDAVGQMASGVAHDFNNLLTVIAGYTDLRIKSLKPKDPIRLDLEEIREAARHATSITSQLLSFSRYQSMQLKVVDLNQLILSIDGILRRFIGDDIELVTMLDPNLGRIRADRVQIEQILFNLAVNARHAMPEGGKLVIDTANFDGNPKGEAGRTNAFVMLGVRDTGCGMNAETKANLFKPFFTTKGEDKGVGLGLATSYGLIRQMGGSVTVWSELNQGAIFRIFLPRVEEKLSAKEKRVVKKAPKGKETVLVAENEPLVRDLVVRVLRELGYQVLQAANGVDAVRIAEKKKNRKIHLLLADIVMPQMGGQDLAAKLCRQRRSMKVLFMSGYTEQMLTPQARSKKRAAFLQKPFLPVELGLKVREVLGNNKK